MKSFFISRICCSELIFHENIFAADFCSIIFLLVGLLFGLISILKATRRDLKPLRRVFSATCHIDGFQEDPVSFKTVHQMNPSPRSSEITPNIDRSSV